MDEKLKKDRREAQGQFRQKYKAAGLVETRLWVPEGSEFLMEILAAQLREGEFSKRPTDGQIERAKEIQKELGEEIPEGAILSKQALALWVKGHKGLVYDRRKADEEKLKEELIGLGLDLAKSKRANTPQRGRPKKRS